MQELRTITPPRYAIACLLLTQTYRLPLFWAGLALISPCLIWTAGSMLAALAWQALLMGLLSAMSVSIRANDLRAQGKYEAWVLWLLVKKPIGQRMIRFYAHRAGIKPVTRR